MTEEDINVAVWGQRHGHMKGVGRQLTYVPSPNSTTTGSLICHPRPLPSRMPSLSSSIANYRGAQIVPPVSQVIRLVCVFELLADSSAPSVAVCATSVGSSSAAAA